jgi:integrase
MPLTDAKARAEKPGETVKKLSDGGGLQLWIAPGGARTWRMAYRFAGKQKMLAIGPYPAVALSAARRAREAAKALLAAGNDPSNAPEEIMLAIDTARRMDRGATMADAVKAAAEAAKLREEIAPGQTFNEVADEWHAKLGRDGRAEVTLGKIAWLLNFARPELGAKSMRSITSRDVLDVLRKVETRGRVESANRLRSVIGGVFRYAISVGKADNDPTVALRGALTTPVTKHRAAITDPRQFGGLLRAVWDFEGLTTIRSALILMAYLAPRPGELRLAEWSEFDLDGATWTIPAARAKMRRAHRKPLPAQAVAVLRDLHKITGAGRLVFPGQRTWSRPLSENTLNAALRRLGFGKDDMTAHGFRAAFSTIANESGLWAEDAIERELGHMDQDEARRAYARGAYWDERTKLMAWWANHCDSLREGGKVIALRA